MSPVNASYSRKLTLQFWENYNHALFAVKVDVLSKGGFFGSYSCEIDLLPKSVSRTNLKYYYNFFGYMGNYLLVEGSPLHPFFWGYCLSMEDACSVTFARQMQGGMKLTANVAVKCCIVYEGIP